MGRRSIWAWGLEDRLPSQEARESLAAQVFALFAADGGERDTALRPLPNPDAIELPAPRIELPPDLASMSRQDAFERALHTRGRGWPDLVRGLRGDFATAPDAVVFPPDEAALERVFEWASGRRVAVIPFGGGSSVVGGVETDVGGAWNGVLSLDLGRLCRVLEVDPRSRLAHIEGGCLGPDLEAQLAVYGLTLRHYPQSFEFSTLGGWIATRSGGHFATGRTRIDDFVAGSRMLAPAGIFESRPLPASGAGPSPDRLVAGSEGSLGVITSAWMRVQPLPAFRAKAAVTYDDFGRGVEAVRAIVQSGMLPSNLRLLDGTEARIHGVRPDGRSVLLLAFESPEHPVDAYLGQALGLCLREGGVVERQMGGGAEGRASESWKAAFFEAPYLQSALLTAGILADTFETACSWTAFAELDRALILGLSGRMRELTGTGIVSRRFTHAYPDGPAPYYTFLTPVREGSEIELWKELKARACDILIERGATITHHHGVGRIHRPWWLRERPELFGRILTRAKEICDPAGILNPGVLI